jgi:hypothetical protein
MRPPRRQAGFGLVLVLIVMAGAAAALFVMNEGVRTMAFETRRMKFAAERRSLEAAAADWADRAAAAGRLTPGERKLPVDALGIDSAEVTLTVAADRRTVRIETRRLSHGRPVTHTFTHTVPAPRR